MTYRVRPPKNAMDLINGCLITLGVVIAGVMVGNVLLLWWQVR